MLFTIDLGNSSLKFGIFEEDKLIYFSEIPTEQDNYHSTIISFLYRNNLNEKNIDDIIISCVVPSVGEIIKDTIRKIFNKEPIEITSTRNYGVEFKVPEGDVIGEDLVVMSTYAFEKFKKEMIVISMGSATVLSHITEDGQCGDWIIAPGFRRMAEALYSEAAQLPEFNPIKKDTYIAHNTIDAMNIGVYDGYIGTIKYLIQGMKNEIGKEVFVVGCGGYGKLLAPHIEEIEYFEADFVTQGLNYIYNRYYK